MTQVLWVDECPRCGFPVEVRMSDDGEPTALCSCGVEMGWIMRVTDETVGS